MPKKNINLKLIDHIKFKEILKLLVVLKNTRELLKSLFFSKI